MYIRIKNNNKNGKQLKEWFFLFLQSFGYVLRWVGDLSRLFSVFISLSIHLCHTLTTAFITVHARAAWRCQKVLTHRMKKTAETRKRDWNGRDCCLSFRLRRLLPVVVGYLAVLGERKNLGGTDLTLINMAGRLPACVVDCGTGWAIGSRSYLALARRPMITPAAVRDPVNAPFSWLASEMLTAICSARISN